MQSEPVTYNLLNSHRKSNLTPHTVVARCRSTGISTATHTTAVQVVTTDQPSLQAES
jgi:hypothetical protein